MLVNSGTDALQHLEPVRIPWAFGPPVFSYAPCQHPLEQPALTSAPSFSPNAAVQLQRVQIADKKNQSEQTSSHLQQQASNFDTVFAGFLHFLSTILFAPDDFNQNLKNESFCTYEEHPNLCAAVCTALTWVWNRRAWTERHTNSPQQNPSSHHLHFCHKPTATRQAELLSGITLRWDEHDKPILQPLLCKAIALHCSCSSLIPAWMQDSVMNPTSPGHKL